MYLIGARALMIENHSAKHTLRFYSLARRLLDMLKK